MKNWERFEKEIKYWLEFDKDKECLFCTLNGIKSNFLPIECPKYVNVDDDICNICLYNNIWWLYQDAKGKSLEEAKQGDKVYKVNNDEYVGDFVALYEYRDEQCGCDCTDVVLAKWNLPDFKEGKYNDYEHLFATGLYVE